ncbi:fibronectin type III domain-containing protein, partial [Robiginitalea sp.]|nr:fibronectin type III domain-containing protein [Robiginitalea sp.]
MKSIFTQTLLKDAKPFVNPLKVFTLVLSLFAFSGLYSQQVYTDANAASIINEANATTGWTTAATINSVTTNPFDGDFALELISTGDGANTGRSWFTTFDAVVGQSYTISIWARLGSQTANSAPAFAGWTGTNFGGARVITGIDWTEYVFEVIAMGTAPEIRIFSGGADSNNEAGATVYIDVISIGITGSDVNPPSSPTNLLATNTTATGTTLSWTAATDDVGVASYEIFQDDVSIGTSGAATTFNVTGLTNFTNYSFTVVAADAAGNPSSASNALNVRTLDNQAPNGVTDLAASGTTASSTVLTWSAVTDNAGVTNYQILNGGAFVANAGTNTTFTVTDLSSLTSYNFTVVAQDAAGNSAVASNIVNVTTLDDIAPEAITDLSASNTTATSTVLSWSAVFDNGGVTNYEVFQNGASIGDAGTATTFTVTGLTQATSYTFTVIAQDAAGNDSNLSNSEVVTTLDVSAPTAPLNLRASNTTDVSTVLAWNAATDNVGVTHYEVFQNGVSIANVGTNLTYTVIGLTNGNTYSFTVVAYDADGNDSNPSNEVSVTTLDTEAPTAASNLRALNTTATSTVLQWNPASDNVGVVNYEVFIDGISIADVGTALSYTATGLTNGSNYSFYVVATDAAGNASLASNTINVSTLDTEGPTAITDLSASNITVNSAVLSWSDAFDNVGVVNYRVLRNGTFLANAGTNLTYTVTGLTNGTAYTFTVLAIDAAGNQSLSSNVVNVTTIDTTPPARVSDLAASNITDTSVRLTWSSVADNLGVTNYQVFRNGVLISNNGTSTNINVTGLTTATNYTFTVVARDAAGNTSTSSNTVNITTLDSQAPTSVSNLTVSNLSDTSLILSWSTATDNVGVINYAVIQDGITIANVGTNLSYAVSGLTNGTSYSFTVVASDLAGNLSIENDVLNVSTLDVDAPTAITDLTASNITNATVDLSWTASTDNVAVTNYQIFRNGVSVGNAGTATTYTVLGLTNGTSYTFTVVANDAAGNQSAVSNAVSITTLDSESPRVISNLTASNTSDTSTRLSWGASSDNVGVVNYEVFQDGTPIASVGTNLTYTVNGLTNATTYSFYVIAQDAAGNDSPVSNIIFVSTPDTDSPLAITDLAATNITGTTTDLTWSASSDNIGVVNYEIFQDGVSIANTGVDTTFSVTGLSSGLSYVFTLIASDAAGNTSEISNSVTVTTEDTIAPSTIVDLASSEITATTLTLSWSPVSDNIGVVNYEIFQNGFSIGDSGTTPSYTVTGLSDATPYVFTVFATDAAGNVSNTSNILIVTTQDSTAPSAIIDLAAANTTATTTELSWSASTDNVGVTNYVILQDGVRIGNAGNNLGFRVIGLSTATSYSFSVLAQDAAGNESLSSNSISITTLDSQVPTSVTDLVASNVTASSVDLTWSASTDNVGVTDYEIYQDGLPIANVGTNLFFNVSGLTNATEYSFTVLALDAEGNSSQLGNSVIITTLDSEAPSAILDLAASNITDVSLDLTWSAAEDNVAVTNYEIFQDGVSIGNSGTATSFSVGSLTNATGYVFTVVASDASDNASISSNAVTVTTLDSEVPSAITDLSELNVTATSVRLNWTESVDNVGVVNYEIFQDEVSIALISNVSSYTVIGLTNGVTYTFSIRAIDAAGNTSEVSNLLEVTTIDIVSPTAITDLVASNVTDTTADLTWSAATDNIGVTNYLIFRNGALLADAGTATSYTVTGLTTATPYSLTVVAQDAFGNTSSVSNVVLITTLDSAPPAPISDLAASNITTTSVRLSWTAANDNVLVRSYEIYQGGELIGTSGLNVSYTVTGLLPETEYSFTVRATDNSSNQSEDSNAAVLTTLPDTEIPTAITDLSASNTTDTTTDLSWSVSSDNIGVVNYEIFQDGESIGNSGTDLSFVVSGLTSVTTYVFTVVAQDAAGNASGASNAVSITTLDGVAPAAILDLAATNITDTSLVLIWSTPEDNVGVTNYQIFQNGTEIGNIGIETSFTVFGLTPESTNTFVVVAQDAAGNNSEVSNSLTVTASDTEAPSAITDLAASNITDTALDLTWSASSDNVGVTNYEIFQDGVSIGNSGSNLTFRVISLSTATAYTFTVRAQDAAGNFAPQSNPVNIVTLDSQIPNAVTDLAASNTTDTSIQLDWSASTDNVGVTDYEIYQDGISIANVGTDLTYTVTGLTNATTYTFNVLAQDAAGNSSESSNAVEVTTLDSEAPSAILDLAASNITDVSLDLTWSAAEDNVAVTNYEIFQDGVSIGNSGTATSFSVGSLTNATGYVFTVVASDASDNASISSNAVTVTTLDSEVPSAITDLSELNVTATSVRLNWTESVDNVGVVNYEIFQDEVSIALISNVSSYTVIGLTNGVTYTFSIRAIDAAGNTSEVSNLLEVTTIDIVSPTAITDLVASNVTDTTADLTWSAATDNIGVTNYLIFRNGALLADAGTATSYTVTGLTTATPYSLTVVAQDAFGNTSSVSNVVLITTLDSAPPAPISDLAASNITTTSVRLSWTAANDNVLVRSYEIYQGGELIGTSGLNVSYTVTGLLPETEYSFTVRATDNSSNQSEDSNAAVLTTLPDTEIPTAITDLSASNTTDTTTDLSWSVSSDNIGVVNYEIFQDGESIGNSGTDLSFVVSGLTSVTTYVFTVVAQDAAGNASGASNAVSITTLDGVAPAAILDLAATNITDTSLVLIWSTPEDNVGVTNYQIFQDGVSIGNTGTELTFVVTGLSSANSYAFTVIAQDAAGNQSELSNVLEIKTVDILSDTDGDGVKDFQDLCPDSPEGSIVDVNGCEVFNLPAGNFSVGVTSASCIGTATGKINVSASNTQYNYIVTITGRSPFNLTSANIFSSEIAGLLPGTYNVCFKVQGNNT